MGTHPLDQVYGLMLYLFSYPGVESQFFQQRADTSLFATALDSKDASTRCGECGGHCSSYLPVVFLKWRLVIRALGMTTVMYLAEFGWRRKRNPLRTN